MHDKIITALRAAGGYAHLSQLVALTSMPEDSVKNYLELLKKDNKVSCEY